MRSNYTRWEPAALRELQTRYGLSVPKFAMLIPVAERTCRYWLAGNNQPGRLASRRLDELAGRQNRTRTFR